MQNAVETYARDVDQSDYYDGYDVNTAIEEVLFIMVKLWNVIFQA